MEMGATVAFQEDGSWQNEAEHQRRRRIGQVKDSRSRLEGVAITRRETWKGDEFNLGFRVKCLPDKTCNQVDFCSKMGISCKYLHCIIHNLLLL